MLIKICTVQTHSKRNSKVSFTSSYGSAHALWAGSPPIQGNKYDVEIQINDVFNLDQNIFYSNVYKYSIGIKDSYVIINGKIEFEDKEGQSLIRIGKSVFFIDFKGYIAKKETFVSIHAREIYFYNTNL